MTLRLANGLRYTPDFMLIMPDGSIVFVEVKGYWRDDARAKVKMVADQFPWWTFVATRRRKGGGWDGERFEPSPDAMKG